MLRVWRVFLYAASGLLLLAAVIHAAEFTELGRRLAAAQLDTAWAASLRVAWIGFALQLVAIVGLLVTACVRPISVGRSALFWCAMLPLAESVVLAVSSGVSAVAALLALAALAIFAAIFTRPTRQAPTVLG